MGFKWIVKIVNGKLTFKSDWAREDFRKWCRENEGKFVILEPKEKISREKRGYFEGALVPAYCIWNEALDPFNPDHIEMVREMFKQEFNGVFIKGMWGKPRKIAKSTSKLSAKCNTIK